MTQRPAHALRLFPDQLPDQSPDQLPDREDGAGASDITPWEIGRLCEDGDSSDLAWLTAVVPEERLADWLQRHGGRQLSRRSRAFWEVLLGRPAGPSSEIGHEIWLL